MSKLPSAYVKFQSSEHELVDSHPAKCWDLVPSYGLVSASRNDSGGAIVVLIDEAGLEKSYPIKANVFVVSHTGAILAEFSPAPVAIADDPSKETETKKVKKPKKKSK